jgi:hypothetical protein
MISGEFPCDSQYLSGFRRCEEWPISSGMSSKDVPQGLNSLRFLFRFSHSDLPFLLIRKLFKGYSEYKVGPGKMRRSNTTGHKCLSTRAV